MEKILLQIYLKLFLSSLGILSIQFLFSLMWNDFLKPMGIGFILFITGVVCASASWKYSYTIPYAHPLLALKSLPRKPMTSADFKIDLFTQEVVIALVVSAVVFVAGFYIVQKRSVK